MRRKFIGIILAVATVAGLAGCGGLGGTGTDVAAVDIQATEVQKEEAKDDAKEKDEKEDSETSNSGGASDLHIGIIIGSIPQSENDRRGVEAFQTMYGEDMTKLAIYLDNFIGELETTVQAIVNPSDDPKMKTIIVDQSAPGTTEALRKVRETRPDTLCVAGGGYKDLFEIGSAVDLVCSNGFVARDYLIIRTAHEFGCDTSVHIFSPHHMAYETMSHRVAAMKEARKELGMELVLEIAPSPTSDVSVTGAQVHILKEIPEWVEKYGKDVAYFCINSAHTEPPLKQLMEYDGYFAETDLPSALMGYPGTLGIDLAAEAGDFDKILAKVESTVAERGGADHFETWVYSHGYTTSAGFAQHALNVLNDESEFNDIDDIAKAYQVFSPKAEQSGSDYTNAETGAKLDNVFLVYQDTYTMGDSGHLMGFTKIEVLEKYFTVK